MSNISLSKYTKKNGDEVTYTYEVDRKKINSAWYQKHKETIKSNRINYFCEWFKA